MDQLEETINEDDLRPDRNELEMTKEVFPSMFDKVDEELIIECQYCRQLVSSFYLDEHEQNCTEKLSVQ